MTERSELGRLAAAAGAVILTIAGVVMGVTLVVAPTSTIMFVQAASPDTTSPVLPPSRPTELEVPAIGLSTGVLVELATTPSGTMEVPGSARSVGWFTAGPTPGEAGTSIIAGHADYGYLHGAFHRLREIRAGDAISVQREDGRTAVFTVYRVETYPQDVRATDLLDAATPAAELRLITCHGDYDGTDTANTVVVSAKLSA